MANVWIRGFYLESVHSVSPTQQAQESVSDVWVWNMKSANGDIRPSRGEDLSSWEPFDRA